jgi:hypothetical protein
VFLLYLLFVSYFFRKHRNARTYRSIFTSFLSWLIPFPDFFYLFCPFIILFFLLFLSLTSSFYLFLTFFTFLFFSFHPLRITEMEKRATAQDLACFTPVRVHIGIAFSLYIVAVVWFIHVLFLSKTNNNGKGIEKVFHKSPWTKTDSFV